MARAPRPLVSLQVIDLMYAQEEARDTETNLIIDHVIALTLLTVNVDTLNSDPLEIAIDPKLIPQMARDYAIERILNEDGTRGVRLTRRTVQ